MMQKSAAKRSKTSPFFIILFVLLAIYSLILVGLLVWAMISAFKTPRDFQTNPVGLPEKIVNNFAEAIKLYKIQVGGIKGQPLYAMFPQMLFNSILYSVGCALFNTAVTCITAYCCARYKYRLSKIVYAIVLVTMTVPIVGSLPSQIKVAQSLGIYNTVWGMWLQSASFLGLYFLVFYETFAALPDSFFEAARIDGAGDLSLMFRIALPLAKNVFLTIFLLNFITYWNDYQTPLLFLKSMPVLSYGLYLITQSNAYVPMIMSAATVVLAPVIIIFIFANKKLMGNLTVGGVKG